MISVPFILCFSAYPLAKRFHKFKESALGERIIISFVFSLAIIILPLYAVGILVGYGFRIVSWMIYVILMVFMGINVVASFRQISVRRLMNVKKLTLFDIVFTTFIVVFIMKYTYFLLLKAIIDYDATVYYFPFARVICHVDKIPLTGYDFARFLKPTGISVFYGWIYALSSSPFTENFRLSPLPFIVITLILIYLISKELGSKDIAKLAVMIYISLPLHDSVLYSASYYPDVCYNALILAVFYFIYKYIKTREIKYCLLGGLSLGLSALFKAQSALFLPAVILTFVPLFSRKSIRIFIVYLTPFTFVLWKAFFIDGNMLSFYNLFTIDGIIASFFVLIIMTAIAFSTEAQIKNVCSTSRSVFRSLKGLFVIFGTAFLVASIWYLRNFFITGSLIWTSSIRDIDLQWAINLLSQIPSQMYQKPDVGSLLLLLILLPFVYPALGTVWIIPKVSGIIRLLKKRESLLMFNWTLGYFSAFFLWVFSGIDYVVIGPRNLYPFAPFFSVFSAVGMLYLVKLLTKAQNKLVIMYILMSLGLISLSQSRLIYLYSPVIFDNLSMAIANLSMSSWELLVGLVLNYPQDLLQASFTWLYFGFGAGSLLLAPLYIKKLIGFFSSKKIEIRSVIKIVLSKIGFLSTVLRRIRKVTVFAVILVLVMTVQMIPYVLLTYQVGDGDIRAFGENQLKRFYPGIYSEIVPYLSENGKSGDVLITVGAGLMGLQYYLRDMRVIDLKLADNLAALRYIIQSNRSATLDAVHDLNVRYFLWPSYRDPIIRKLSETSYLLDVAMDPRYFVLSMQIGEWRLYEYIEDRYIIDIGWKEDSFTKNWTYYSSTEGLIYNFTSDGEVLNFTVSGVVDGFSTYKYTKMPSIRTSEYQYVVCRIKGTSNARWLFRLFFQDGTSYDFPWWYSPSENWMFYTFSYSGDKLLSSNAFLAVKTVDGEAAYICIDYYFIMAYKEVG